MRYVIFRSFDNYVYANILLLRLKTEGIECYIKDENTITIDPLLSPALGGMKLMIIESDLAKATQLMHEFDLEYLKTLVCPACGEKKFQRISRSNRPPGFLSRLIATLVNGAPETDTITYRCSSCGFDTDDLSSLDQEDFLT